MRKGTRVKVVPWSGVVRGLTFFPSMFCLEGTIISDERDGSFQITDDIGLTWIIPTCQLEILTEQVNENTDSIVESVLSRFKQRSEAGIKKYNTTLDRNDLNTLQWLTHLQEELMDATLYIERLKQEYETRD